MSGADRPLSILFIVSEWGAPTQTFVRREARAARDAGNSVVVLSLRRPTTKDAPGPVVYVRSRYALETVARHPVRSLRTIARTLRRSKPSTAKTNVGSVVLGLAAAARLPHVDWIHAHFAWAAASSADALATVRRQPFSVFAHAHDIFDSRYIDDYTGDKLRRAAFVAVESPAIKTEVDERFGCSSHVVRMGVPRDYLAETDSPADTDLDPVVVSVGSLVPKKGHDILLRAVARLDSAVRLEIIGEGPDRARLETLISELGIAHRARLVGSLPEDEVLAHLDRASVFCLASQPTETGDRDGVPNVLIEAMARSVPCISTDVSGIPDLLGDGRGVVVPARDVEGLSVALKRALADPPGTAAMVRSAHAHIDEHYRVDRNWAHLETRMRSGIRAASSETHREVDASRLRPSWRQHSFIQLRELGRALREEAAETADGMVLDLGCGGKPYAELFGDRPYVGIDLLATHGQPDCLAVAERLPVRKAAAAVVLSTQQLEHVEEPRAVLAEALRALCPGGRLLLSTHGVWPYHPDPHDYWRWTEEGLRKLMHDCGFDVLRVHRQGGAATAAASLLLYPLGAVVSRRKRFSGIGSVVIAAVNLAALVVDGVLLRTTRRHLASASYLVVATPNDESAPMPSSAAHD